MVNGLNAVEIAVGGVSGAAFGSIFDGITVVLRNAAEFTTSRTNIKSTLEALQPLIREIEGKNNRLLLQDEELKDLKKEIEAGLKRVQVLSEGSVWNYCMRPFYNMELDGMDKSLKRLLRILQVQGVRDVKEVLVQVNDCKTDVNKISIQLDDCKTEIVAGISAWKGKTTDQLDQVASNGEETLILTKRVLDRVERINGPSGFVPISDKVASLVEEEALGSSLLTMRHAVDEALSKPNPHYNIIFRIEEALRRVVEELGDADENRKLDMGVHLVKWFRIKVEEGTELIRKCSNVVEWTDRKMVKYANKLDDLVKFLEAFGQRLKRNNSENQIEIENEKLIFMKSNRPTDDVNGENRTEIENEKLIFMKSNRPTDDVNGENWTEIENEKLIFMKSNRPTDDVNGENRTEIENEKLIFMKSNRPTDDVNGENRTEIENEKLISMKSNRPTDDVNGENRTEIENTKLIFMKSNRPTDDVNGENRTEIENAKLISMKSNRPTDDVNGENRTKIENEMLIFKKSNRPTDDVNGLRNDGMIGHHDLSVFSSLSTLAATSNSAEENKLGEGGFGPVYKGKLAMGQKKAVKWHRMLFFKKSNRPTDDVNGLRNDGKIGHQDLSVFSYSSILAATSNFAEENKLGEGGFGQVYKGKLAMGQEIAVKRLSRRSGQGTTEFYTELILNELQHTNLVQLFGFCIHGEEMMLIYEYLKNKSLDRFLFDPTRGLLLDWKKRFSILEGIAQGLLYLHKYSRKKVIHKDLKPSNILLDENMNPKISDFGLAWIFTQNQLEANMNPKFSDFGTARIFTQNQLEAITSRICGTFGYMSPEYAMHGIISVKSDVYSFGVLMLEIISGRENSSFYNDDRALDLVGYAWELWKEGAGLELMDPTLGNSFIKEQLLRCIHVGLLCVEENAADRPTMSDVISMLINESLPLASPTKPAFYVGRRTVESQTVVTWSQQLQIVASANYMSISDSEGR